MQHYRQHRFVLLATLAIAAMTASACPGEAPGLRDGPTGALESGGPRDGPGAPSDGARAERTTPTADGSADSTPPLVDSMPPISDSGGTFNGKPGEYTRTHAGRTYRVFVPSGYSAQQPIPLLVGFHGAGDSGSNFYAFCKVTGVTGGAGPARYLLVVPDTKSPRSDWANWSGNPNNDIGAMKTEMDEVVALLDALAKDYNIDSKRRHVVGFSNGGLFSAIGGFHRSQSFASLTILGYGWGSQGYPAVTPARKIPVQLAAGTADSFHGLAQSSATFLQSKGHTTVFRSASGVGHSFSQLLGSLGPATLTGWMLTQAL